MGFKKDVLLGILGVASAGLTGGAARCPVSCRNGNLTRSQEAGLSKPRGNRTEQGQDPDGSTRPAALSIREWFKAMFEA